MPKRTLLEALAGDRPNLWLKLAGGERLPAHREVLAWACTCVRDLPPGDEWDLSGLVIEGAPAQRAVAAAWLASIYPPRDDVEPEDAGGVPLADVLAFADAVGTSRAAMRSLCARHPCDALTVKVGDKQAELSLDGRAHYVSNGALWWGTAVFAGSMDINVNPAQLASLRDQLASQLERLLLLAYRLDLAELEVKLHHFIHTNTVFDNSVLTLASVTSEVFSARVRAAVPRERLENVWIECVQRKLCKIAAGAGQDALLVPTDDGLATPLKFKAKLGRPYMGVPAGTAVEAELDMQQQILGLKVGDGAVHNIDFGLHLGN